ncbi:hypothetical protein GCM10010406_18780 [Streptomyces thermolineatus]|uniref:Transmembrane protein n=1 Tax=Streptomyces thermolineatus TaxID=44033 RepID=A0ABN3LGU7_9ACTN
MAIDDITRSSLRQTGRILVSFLPLFVFLAIAWGHSLLRLRIGLYAGAALLLVMALGRLSRGAMMWAMAAFFAVAIVLGLWLENVWVVRHMGMLPGTALLTAAMVLGRPFVQDYARADVPAEQQETAGFVRSCYVLSSFWASVFLLMVVNAVAAFSSGLGRLFHLAVQLALLVVATAYTAAYTARARHRRAAAGFTGEEEAAPRRQEHGA